MVWSATASPRQEITTCCPCCHVDQLFEGTSRSSARQPMPCFGFSNYLRSQNVSEYLRISQNISEYLRIGFWQKTVETRAGCPGAVTGQWLVWRPNPAAPGRDLPMIFAVTKNVGPLKGIRMAQHGHPININIYQPSLA